MCGTSYPFLVVGSLSRMTLECEYLNWSALGVRVSGRLKGETFLVKISIEVETMDQRETEWYSS